MVTLNLRDDCVARTATNFRRGMTDKRFLELEITAWLASPVRKRQINGELYYDGKQAVLCRKRMALDDDAKARGEQQDVTVLKTSLPVYEASVAVAKAIGAL